MWRRMLWVQGCCWEKDIGRSMLRGEGCRGERDAIGTKMLWGEQCYEYKDAVGKRMLWGKGCYGYKDVGTRMLL